ncbi:MAG: hypothetical protein EPN93_05355 [Spirochaetes bacterium]|nr:MAG: hypothetical protein EPN93_05355 [Spirochaetota bacterium]
MVPVPENGLHGDHREVRAPALAGRKPWRGYEPVNPRGRGMHVREATMKRFMIIMMLSLAVFLHCTDYISGIKDELDLARRVWFQDAYLKASNVDAGDKFGVIVAVSGDTMVVGTPWESSNQTGITNIDGSAATDNGALESGAAYVYKKDGSGNWIQDAYIKASNAGASDWFGVSVAVSGDTIVVGASGEDGSGAAYVFKKNSSGDWIEDDLLKASNAESGDNFGHSVAVSGDTIVVGAYGEDSGQITIDNSDNQPTSVNNLASDSGAAYVYKKDGSGNWIQDAYLKASNAELSDHFGYSVAISGDTIVVGATGEAGSGAAYVFKKNSSGDWIEDDLLKASNAEASDNFGISVAVSGDTIVVGAYAEDSDRTFITNDDELASTDNSAGDSGAAYVFKRDGSGNWIQDACLKASNARASDGFGDSVAVSGDIIVVGAHSEKSGQTTITNTDGLASTVFTSPDYGAAYVFKKDGSGNWFQDAYLKASNAGGGDFFGYVAVSGDTIVVGAIGEDSGQTTIMNTDGSANADDSAVESGAAYVFTLK